MRTPQTPAETKTRTAIRTPIQTTQAMSPKPIGSIVAVGTTVAATVISVFQSGSGTVGTQGYRLATQDGARIDYLIMTIAVAAIGMMLARALRRG
ncbi:hypothetical protein GFD17_07045 [Bifidobacterium sp. SMB2]|uniref:Uncharacterized protein n=1 Tax=Bifidobacterium saimiriisciurei TaxID=2661627 RepID=A0ABX0CDV4_9BIFI|nr:MULTISPECIES: hypothetical protein [Bifidobacterium]NEG96506.1 hypothetical protein [Bifidobacterium sp. SMB2]NEH10577.1 hypothetical protein [Bifidobacterium saimiriisciurei]NEH10640.1 hypothetical protein [Bifidobacterium saimiriisciurei]